jgi:signal transduction histidine kinase
MKTLLRYLTDYTALKQMLRIEPELPPKDYCNNYSRDIQTANLTRIRLFSLVLFLLNGVLLLRDIFSTKADGLWEQNIGYKYLFYLHLALGCSTLIFYFLARFGLQNTYEKFKRNGFITLAFGVLILLWSAVLSGWVGSYFYGSINEYVIAMFGIAATLYFRPLVSIIFFVGVQAGFIVIMNANYADPNSSGQITNSIILSILAWFLSRITYTARLREFLNRFIIAGQKADIERVNKELQQQNTYLAELNIEKNEFMGIAAHDLKNPLAAIMLKADIMRRYWKQLTHKELLANVDGMYSSAQRMKDIITNLLDTHAIESGAVKISPVEYSLTTLVADEVEQFRERAEAKNITLNMQADPPDFMIVADTQILREVMDNLISNAVKYSPHGKNVYIAVSKHDKYCTIKIQDEGPGISEEDKRKLFGKFQRLTAKPTGGEHSTGLGLSIVKKFIEMMGGRVWCESTLGAGAAFIVELPVEYHSAKSE